MEDRRVTLAYFDKMVWPSRIAGAVLLLLAGPLILLLVVLVRCTSRGPGIYRQARVGRGGKEFYMYKVRTMYKDAEVVSGPVWCTPTDSRITPVGRVLRRMHLDELPQLINVARGEMNLVGPRPERPEFVRWLASEIPHYRKRLHVRPGVTGLAQINLPPDETIDCVRKKVVIDGHYIERADLSLDARILACTFLRMIGIRQGRAARWLGLTCRVELRWETQHDGARAPHTWVTNGKSSPSRHAYTGGDGNGVAAVAMTASEENGLPAALEVLLADPIRQPK